MTTIAEIRADQDRVDAAQARREKIKALACFMCSQSGLDPETLVYGGMVGVMPVEPERGPKGCIIVPKPEACSPAWHLFYREATCAVDWLESHRTKLEAAA